MHAILELVGIPTASISSTMGSQARANTMTEWNAPDSPLRVLVLNTNISSAGLNCHINCYIGIITGFLWNAAGLLQGMGRLFRLGQPFAVIWYLLHMAKTINDWIQERILRKVWRSLPDVGQLNQLV